MDEKNFELTPEELAQGAGGEGEQDAGSEGEKSGALSDREKGLCRAIMRGRGKNDSVITVARAASRRLRNTDLDSDIMHYMTKNWR